MAASKTDVEVIIDGRVITLSGYESADYIQKVATYLNGKLAEFRKDEGYSRLSIDFRNVLMQINLADDYFKAQQEIEDLKKEAESREKDLYDLKHELVATQMKMQTLERSLKSARQEAEESEKKAIRLETELRTLKDG